MTQYIVQHSPRLFPAQYVADAIHDCVYLTLVVEDAKQFDTITEAELFMLEYGRGLLSRYAIVPREVPDPIPVRSVFPVKMTEWWETDFQSFDAFPKPVYDLGGES